VNITFHIDHKGGVPIYVQIMDQIKHLIATGALQPGQQLPTIRELAVGLTVNLHTVAHAYAELEREGFLTVQRGRGTFITDGQHEGELEDLRAEKLQAIVETMFAEVRQLGYEPDEVEQALIALVDRWRQRPRATEQSPVDREKE
jgi:GntR family transcriptional regulator